MTDTDATSDKTAIQDGSNESLSKLSTEERMDIILGDLSTPEALQIARRVANLPCEASAFDAQAHTLPRARQPNVFYPLLWRTDFDEEESEAEAYNRIWQAFQSAKESLYVGRYKGTWQHFDRIDSKGKITDDHLPMWMKPSAMNATLQESDEERDEPPKPELAPLPLKEFTGTWVNEMDIVDKLQHRVKADASVRIPSSTEPLPDPRRMDAAEWRDAIRRWLNFEVLGMNIASLKLYSEDIDIITQEKIWRTVDLLVGSAAWEQAQVVFNGATSSAIRYTTRDSDSGEVIFENTGIPAQLIDFSHPPVSQREDDPEKSMAPLFEAASTVQPEVKVLKRPAQVKYRERILELVLDRELPYKIVDQTNLEADETVLLANKLSTEEKEEVTSNAETVAYYQFQAAWAGTKHQVGPDVEKARVALGMEPVTDQYRHLALGTDRRFFPWQVSAVAWMFSTATGHIPGVQLRSGLGIRGGIVADSTGLGKTITILTYLALFPHLMQVFESDIASDNRERHKGVDVQFEASEEEGDGDGTDDENQDLPLGQDQNDDNVGHQNEDENVLANEDETSATGRK